MRLQFRRDLTGCGSLDSEYDGCGGTKSLLLRPDNEYREDLLLCFNTTGARRPELKLINVNLQTYIVELNMTDC